MPVVLFVKMMLEESRVEKLELWKEI